MLVSAGDLAILAIIVIIGLIAGWLTSQIVQGLGLIGDLVIGVVGALIGSWVLPDVGIQIGAGIILPVINATIGAMILLALVNLGQGGGWPGR